MREIRFRIWNKERREMRSSHNVVLDAQGSIYWQFGYEAPMPLLRDDHEIMFFTGLKDKNGKDIYEGDVAKITTALFPETKLDTYTDISVMEFCEKTAQFKFMVKNSLLEGDEIPVMSVEVIGNIYQNPELLTTPK